MRIGDFFSLKTPNNPTVERAQERIAIQLDSRPLDDSQRCEVKNTLVKFIQSGRLPKEKYMEWRKRQGVSASETLDDFQILTLYGDLLILYRMDEWCTTPF